MYHGIVYMMLLHEKMYVQGKIDDGIKYAANTQFQILGDVVLHRMLFFVLRQSLVKAEKCTDNLYK